MSFKSILSIGVGACMIGTAAVTTAAGAASLASGIKTLREEKKMAEDEKNMVVDPGLDDSAEDDDDPESVPGTEAVDAE